MKLKWKLRCVKVRYGESVEIPADAKAITLNIQNEEYAEVAWLEFSREKVKQT